MRKHIIFICCCLTIGVSVFAQKTLVTNSKKPKTPVKKSTPVKPVKNYITTYYEIPDDSSHSIWYEGFKEVKFLEEMKNTLNSVFKINTPMKLTLKGCGMVNAFWDPEEKELKLCYELLNFMQDRYRAVYKNEDTMATKVGQALAFIYFHEVGHALIDVLDIPLTGKEEDAADYFSFYFLASNEVPEGVDAAMEGARFFKTFAIERDSINAEKLKKGEKVELPFWDEHSFEMQRFYTIFSLIYGSNPDKYDYLVSEGYIGERRPIIAINEFKKIKRGWDRVLKNHIKWHK